MNIDMIKKMLMYKADVGNRVDSSYGGDFSFNNQVNSAEQAI